MTCACEDRIVSDASGACFSEDRRFRYLLWRRWGTGSLLGVVMLNPSIADETALDPTLRRVKGLAERDGYGNPAFKSKYADLESVIDATRPALQAQGIAVIQASGGDGSIVTIETMFLHESGEWIRSTLGLKPSKADPQGAGSAITYGRRYSLLAMCGLAPEDDDGNAASKAPRTPATAPERASAPPSNVTPMAGNSADKQRRLAMVLFGKLGYDAEQRYDFYESVCGRSAVGEPIRSWADAVANDKTSKVIDALNAEVRKLEDAPAKRYRDGWSIYALHGINIPDGVAVIDGDRPGLTVERVTNEANAEVRRVLVELYGRNRYLREAGAHRIDVEHPPAGDLWAAPTDVAYRALWRLEQPNDEPIVVVDVVNQSPEPIGWPADGEAYLEIGGRTFKRYMAARAADDDDVRGRYRVDVRQDRVDVRATGRVVTGSRDA